MRIGISRPSKTPEEAVQVLRAARDFGFEGVQLKPSQYADVIESGDFEQRYGALSDLACGGFIVYPSGEPAGWQEAAQPVLGFAGRIKAQHICFCSGVYQTGATDAQVAEVASALSRIGADAAKHGLRISIHNHVNSVVETETDIARVLDAIEPALCGLTLDTAHAAKAGMPDLTKVLLRFRERLLNVHLKDLDADGKFCALGQGILDLRPILAALEESGYDEWLIVDEETAGISTEEAFRIARDYLRERGRKS